MKILAVYILAHEYLLEVAYLMIGYSNEGGGHFLSQQQTHQHPGNIVL